MDNERQNSANAPLYVAIETLNRKLLTREDLDQYLSQLEDEYLDIPDGSIEVNQMVRAAEIMTNYSNESGSRELDAVYAGELLGVAFINQLTKGEEVALKTGYAERFLTKYAHQVEHPTQTSSDSEINYQQWLSDSLQSAFSKPLDSDPMATHYEAFVSKTAGKLYQDDRLKSLSMTGFRLILTEALQPETMHDLVRSNVVLDPSIFLQPHVNQELFGTEHNDPDAQQSSSVTISQLAENYSVSSKELEEIVKDPVSFEWIDITSVKLNILNKYRSLQLSEQDIEDTSAIELELNKFVVDYDFLHIDDILKVNGELWGVNNDEGDTAYPKRYLDDSEIHGAFMGIYMVTVPLHLGEARDNEDEKPPSDDEPRTLVPAIRIMNPMFVEVSEKSVEKELTHHKSLDLPVHYNSFTIEKADIQSLEEDA
jgi:hypothetical protein